MAAMAEAADMAEIVEWPDEVGVDDVDHDVDVDDDRGETSLDATDELLSLRDLKTAASANKLSISHPGHPDPLVVVWSSWKESLVLDSTLGSSSIGGSVSTSMTRASP